MDTGIDMENTALPRESSLSGKKKKKRARYIALPFIIVGYVLVGILVALIALKSGNFLMALIPCFIPTAQIFCINL